MKIQILGAHNIETRETRLTSLLVDGILALDAGSLSSGLSIEDQCEVKAVLLTHRHFDKESLISPDPARGDFNLASGFSVNLISAG